MQKIPLPLAQPDMVLEKPITRENGMILVGQGTVLTESLIARLVNMDITSIVVEGNPLDLGGGSGSASGRRGERITHLFRKAGDDKFMQELQTFFQEYFARKGALEQMAATAEEKGEE